MLMQFNQKCQLSLKDRRIIPIKFTAHLRGANMNTVGPWLQLASARLIT